MVELAGADAITLLSRLHAHKNRGYGDAWRKRGELLSIFTNLARKYDRLVVSLDEGRPSSDERILDTAADLCVYASKYLTWLADEHPAAFDAASPVSSSDCADDGTTRGLDRVLGALNVSSPAGVPAAWEQVKTAFEPLDAGLVAQAENDDGLTWERKVDLAWAVSESSASLLLALAEEDPQELIAWRSEIEAME